MMSAAIVVNYSAYAAARAAIVWVPTDYPGGDSGFSPEAENTVNDSGSFKRSRIHMAAAIGCLPVAGTSGVDPDPSGGGLSTGIKTYYADYGETPPNWTGQHVSLKAAYAYQYTSARLRPSKQGSNVYQWFEDLTVDVTHQYYLAVPFADAIFTDGGNAKAVEYYKGSWKQVDPAKAGRTTTISASCTLNNEGVSDVIPVFVDPYAPTVP